MSMNALTPRARLRLATPLWPVVTALLLLLQLFWPARAWMTLLLILGGGWLVGFFWAHSLQRSLLLRREMRYGWAQVGDRLEERFTVFNPGWAPALWLEIEDHSTLPHSQAGRVTAVWGRTQTVWKVEQVCTRRGLYTLGPATLHAADPLGIYAVEVRAPETLALLVLPPVFPLPAVTIAPGGQAGEGRRARRSALESTVSVETVREYVAGDPLKAIHWPTSARREALYVRQFDHTPASDWWIFLDLEAAVQAGSGDDSTTEHGIILAASLADLGLRRGHPVGLVTCGQELVWLPPACHSGQLLSILRALAVLQNGQESLSALLKQAQPSLQRGASVILITPNVTADWLAPLTRLLRASIAPSVFLLDPRSFGGEADASGAMALLHDYQIACTLVRRELLNRFPAPGQEGQWEWRIVGPGKAVPVRKPRDTGWRKLG
jgi:uncharacterized protein (DUF58 family)